MKRAVVAGGVSVALHAAVVLSFFQQAAPTVVAVAGARPPVQFEVMRLRQLPGREKPATQLPVKAPRSSPVMPASGTADIPSPPVDQPSDGVGEAPEAAPQPGEERGAAEPSAGMLDTTALSLRLQQVALRCYPAAARRFRQTGEAQVRFCVDAAGALRESTVVQSTGSQLLDGAASGCVVPGAAPFGPETFGRCFTVPVRFRR